MKALPPSNPTRATIHTRSEVAQALRDLAARVEHGQGYYSEVTLDAYTQPSGLPMREARTQTGNIEMRMANTKYIGFTLLLRESNRKWLANLLTAEWITPPPPVPPIIEDAPFELTPQ
jgi:hypothetical protein